MTILFREAIDTTEFVKEIDYIFESNAVPSYTMELFKGDDNLHWPITLASCIQQLLSKSRNLPFLTTKLEDEKSCYSVFKKLVEHFSMVNIKMARTFDE